MKSSFRTIPVRRALSRAVSILAVITAAIAGPMCHAISITSGPDFKPSTNAPLAGLLSITTDVDSRVSIVVSSKGGLWERHFPGFRTTHALPLVGFKPGVTHDISIQVRDREGNLCSAGEPIRFVTAPLPANFPPLHLRSSQPSRMEPGYTLFRLQNNNPRKAYVTMVDAAGEVVWYSTVTTTLDVRQLPNGNLFIPLTARFTEVNLLGDTVGSWTAPSGWSIDFHDGVPTPQGTILYINGASRAVTNFPTSSTNPGAPRATTAVLYNRIAEYSMAEGKLTGSWSLIDMLDPLRITYLTFTVKSALGWDCEHANAVIEDPRDNSIIVSMRHQDAVVKFSRSTGQLKWILGPHENWAPEFQRFLLTPKGEPFAWNYAQHAPMITPQGTLLVYDNGNFRASPFDDYVQDIDNATRAVEYRIDEDAMEVAQVWEYGGENSTERLFTDRVGNADWLPQTGNVLVTFGNVNYIDGRRPSPYSTKATMLRIQEVTHTATPEVVFDLEAFDRQTTDSTYAGCFAYRSHRIRDFYAAQPVSDLRVTHADGAARLGFSGDAARNYRVQASQDLIDWEDLGFATHQGGGGFEFLDEEDVERSTRFYRVLTE